LCGTVCTFQFPDAAKRWCKHRWAPGWYGDGWYWDPWFDAYTFIPGDGIFFGPFGWGFYSPWYVFGAPYFGFGYWGGYYHHFEPGYQPPYRAVAGIPRGVGHAYQVRGNVARGFAGGGFGRGGFGTGFARGGFGGGFHGGFDGGGFHGGGRGR
jgi:hypothetical protein